MRIGYVSLPGPGATDACLAQAVGILTAGGLPLAGTVQTNLEQAGGHVCDMDLPAFLDFADGLAQPLPANPEAVARWALRSVLADA